MARTVGSDLDFGGVARLLNLPAPVAASEPVRLADLNSAVEGIAWKDGARVATQANISLASPGASIDGISMALNDRVLVRAQTSAAENGIYIWNGAAVAMTRSLDANTFDELEGAALTVEEGTSAGVTYRQTAVNGTIGTTPVSWGTFGTSAPTSSETTAGLAEAATQAETDAGTLGAPYYVSPEKLAGWSGRARKFAANIGDGSATQYTVTHNFNTRDLVVSLYRNSGAYDEVIADVEHTTVNSVTIRFASAPAANAFRVMIVA